MCTAAPHAITPAPCHLPLLTPPSTTTPTAAPPPAAPLLQLLHPPLQHHYSNCCTSCPPPPAAFRPTCWRQLPTTPWRATASCHAPPWAGSGTQTRLPTWQPSWHPRPPATSQARSYTLMGGAWPSTTLCRPLHPNPRTLEPHHAATASCMCACEPTPPGLRSQQSHSLCLHARPPRALAAVAAEGGGTTPAAVAQSSFLRCRHGCKDVAT